LAVRHAAETPAKMARLRNASRRRLLAASIGLSMPLVRVAAAQPGSLIFAAQGGLFRNLYEPAIVQPFRRAHPDNEVLYHVVPSGGDALSLLRQQRERPQIDVVLLDLAPARVASDEGLLEKLPAASMPVLADLAPGASFPGIDGVALFTEPLVLLYDAAQMRPPISWTVLWDGTEDRALALSAPPDPAAVAFVLVAAKLFGGGGDRRSIRDGIAAIAQLAPRVIAWDPAPDVYRWIGEGGARLGVGWNMPAQVEANRTRGRLGAVFPGDGTISRVTVVCLVKGTRQPVAARAFIAWLLGADAQKTMVERMFLGPVNTKARYREAALSRTANTPSRAAHEIPVDWVSVAAMGGDIVRLWREIVPGA
jgi:putative spermidine/putrescine transport system substrate-binding protein